MAILHNFIANILTFLCIRPLSPAIELNKFRIMECKSCRKVFIKIL